MDAHDAVRLRARRARACGPRSAARGSDRERSGRSAGAARARRRPRRRRPPRGSAGGRRARTPARRRAARRPAACGARVSGGVAATSCSPGSGRWPGRVTWTSPPRVRASVLTATCSSPASAAPTRRRPWARQRLADLAGLGVAVEHGVDHLVVRAGAHRVVGGVAHHRAPRHVEQRARASSSAGANAAHSGSASCSSARSARAAAWRTSTRLEATPRQQVGAGAAAQLAPPAGQAVRGRAGDVLGSERQAHVEASGARRRSPRRAAAAGRAGAGGGRCRSSRGSGRRARGRPTRLDPRVEPGEERARRRRACGRRCRSPSAGTRPARRCRRAPPTRTRCGRPRPARRATRRRGRGRPGRAAAASGRRGRTCRAGSRRPSRLRRPASSSARSIPSSRSRTRVSPDTRNSSGSVYHGPIATRPDARGAPAARPPARAASPGSRRPRPSARRAGSG